jgi:lipoprotein
MKNMKGCALLAFAVIVAIGFVGGCAKSKEEDKRPDARSLYYHSAMLIRGYTDSLIKARDTLELQRLNDNFETAIDKLNFTYPKETDMAINEGENDTLTLLTDRYIRVRGAMWRKLKSVSTDSVSESKK